MSVSDLRASLRYRLVRSLNPEQPEGQDPDKVWPEAVRRRPFQAHGGNARFMAYTGQEIIVAGPAETGKTISALNKLNDLAWSNPGMQAVICRKVRQGMAGNVLQTFQRKVLPSASPVTVLGGSNPERFMYPNGSTIWVGGMDDPSKILSSERDIIYVNQAEELDLPDWETLLTRVTGRAGVLEHPQLIGDCNPAAPTHWIKARAAAGTLKLFESWHKDNPVLFDPRTGKITVQGKRSLSVLDRLTGARKMRLRHGIWAVPEGAIYDVFDEEIHKLKGPMKPPALWPRFVAIDPVGAYVGALFIAWDPQQERLVVYDEYLEPFGETTQGHAANILRKVRDDAIFAWICGQPSERQSRLDFGQALGVGLQSPPDVPVWTGIDRVYELLKDARLLVGPNCVNLLSEIGSYERKFVHGQPTEQIQHKERYHLLDCLRYAVVWLVAPTEGLQLMRVQVTV